MRYLLDTNICILIINRRPQGARDRFLHVSIGDMAVSSITVSKLHYGVEKSRKREQNARALQKFLLPLMVLPYDDEAAQQYGYIRAQLEREGKVIGAMDIMIAAHALALGLKVITNNTREFQRIPGLEVEDWSVPAG